MYDPAQEAPIVNDRLYRSFDSDAPAPDAHGPEFDLGGEHFRCVPVAPAGVLAAMVSSVGVDGKGNTVINQIHLVGFVLGVLIETDPETGDPADDVVRFERLCNSKTAQVSLTTLAKVVTWLTEVYMGRPTRASGS